LERGFGSEVCEIQIIPIGDPTLLPFRHNVTWVDLPEFELRITTADAVVSWLVRRDDDRLYVVLPNFCEAPWTEPILEKRGGHVEFSARKFAGELGKRLGLEFVNWAPRLNGLVKIRAFALNVDPSPGWIQPSLLTDKDPGSETPDGRWNLGDWRLHDFTSTPSSGWPYGEDLCQSVKEYVAGKEHRYKHPKFDYWVQAKEDFEILVGCAMALEVADFQSDLQRLDLSADFQLGVFHGHDERCECNFVLRENQDLSVLIRV
jgi:hypothetical protein